MNEPTQSSTLHTNQSTPSSDSVNQNNPKSTPRESLIMSPTKKIKLFDFSLPNKENQIPLRLSKVDLFWLKHKLKFPCLFELCLKFLSIPASSGPVERLFSLAGYINRPHRARMATKNLERTTILKCNIKHLDLNNADLDTFD